MPVLKVKVAVFDWSGTISDDAMPCYNAAMSIRRHYNCPGADIPFDEWMKMTRANAVEFLRAHGVAESDEKIMELFSKYYGESPERPKPFGDVEAVLSFLKSKGILIGVVSSHPDEHLRKEMESYGFGKYVAFASGSTKNKAEALKALSVKLGVSASEIVYLGDMVWDVRAAKEAGVRSAAILRGYHGRRLLDENPDIVIDDMAGLGKFIA